MSQDLTLAQDRLDNIRTVEPLLSALRTISLGSWQAALKQRAGARRYGEHLLTMLPPILARLPAVRTDRAGRPPARVVAVMVGSERGLCGRFNATVVERAEQYLAEPALAIARYEEILEIQKDHSGAREALEQLLEEPEHR
ncbi:MAG: F0F1 ATP synthase subunit gamma, partial [Chloroflexi bacterium]|nr:F0F1 ATP synthase subunit gamma [Chloroflexota bacterium]